MQFLPHLVRTPPGIPSRIKEHHAHRQYQHGTGYSPEQKHHNLGSECIHLQRYAGMPRFPQEQKQQKRQGQKHKIGIRHEIRENRPALPRYHDHIPRRQFVDKNYVLVHAVVRKAFREFFSKLRLYRYREIVNAPVKHQRAGNVLRV